MLKHLCSLDSCRGLVPTYLQTRALYFRTAGRQNSMSRLIPCNGFCPPRLDLDFPLLCRGIPGLGPKMTLCATCPLRHINQGLSRGNLQPSTEAALPREWPKMVDIIFDSCNVTYLPAWNEITLREMGLVESFTPRPDWAVSPKSHCSSSLLLSAPYSPFSESAFK